VPIPAGRQERSIKDWIERGKAFFEIHPAQSIHSLHFAAN
jgi:hypothetical protein